MRLMQIQDLLFHLLGNIRTRLTDLEEVLHKDVVVIFKVFVHLIEESDSHHYCSTQVSVGKLRVLLLSFATVEGE
jgi:hypothetical protein